MKKLKNVCAIDDYQTKCLESSVDTVNRYLSTHYQYQIDWSSPIKSHCATYGLSQPLDNKNSSTEFHEVCHKDHDSTCEFCDLLPQIFVAIKNVLKKSVNQNQISEEDMDSFEYDLDICEENIYAYKYHVIRAFAQNHTWEKDIQRGLTDTVYITQDWVQFVHLCY